MADFEMSGGGQQKCTLTVLVDDTVLTAGHCGPVDAQVSVDGVAIGEIEENLLLTGQGLDIATVSVDPGVSVEPSPVNTSYIPRAGDGVSIISGQSGTVSGTVTNGTFFTRSAPTPEGPKEATVWAASASGNRGDSGAPVIHDGDVVGIVQGGDLEESTLVTPLELMP